MSRILIGIIIGFGLAVAGQAAAQYFESYDNRGNGISGYTDSTGNTTWQDRRGNSGYQYSVPSGSLPVIPRSPC